MTDDSRELLVLFEKYRRTRRLVYESACMINFYSTPTEDQKSGKDDQEALEYLQAFANIQEEQAKSESGDAELESLGDTEEFENSDEDNAEVQVHDE